MRGHGLRSILAVFLVIAFASSMLLGQSLRGIVYANNGVSLNGVAIYSSSAAKSGDKIQTASTGTMFSSEGVSVSLGANSALQVEENTLQLVCGSAVITESRPVSLRVGEVMLTPSGSGESKYEVSNVGGQLRATASTGQIAFSQGGQTTILNPGESKTAAGDGSCPVVPQTQTAAAHSNRKIVAIGAAGAGGAAIAVVVGRGNGKGQGKVVSPNNP